MRRWCMRSSGTTAGTTTELTPSGDPAVGGQKKNFQGGLFKIFLKSTLLHMPPLRFHVVGGCYNRTRDRYRLWHWQSTVITTRFDLIQNSVTSHSQDFNTYSTLKREYIFWSSLEKLQKWNTQFFFLFCIAICFLAMYLGEFGGTCVRAGFLSSLHYNGSNKNCCQVQ